MKVLVFSALVTLAYGTAYTNSTTYIRVDMTASGQATTGAANTSCVGTVTRSILLKPIANGTDVTETLTHPTQWQYSGARPGSCASFLLVNTNDPDFQPQGVVDKSIALYDLTGGKYAVVTYAAFDCSIAGQQQATGFVFSPNTSGSTDCSGAHGTPDDTGGLIVVNGGQAIEAKGTLFLSKRAIVGQFNGPFTTSACNILANSKTSASLPLVIPLEDAVASPTTQNESAISTDGICFNWGIASAAHVLKASTTATAGELTLELSTGGPAAWTNRSTCVHGSTYSKVTFAIQAGGQFSNCVQSYDNASPAALQASTYWSFVPDTSSIGDWPSWPTVASPPGTPASPCPASPAALHLSAAMTVLFALIGMMM